MTAGVDNVMTRTSRIRLRLSRRTRPSASRACKPVTRTDGVGLSGGEGGWSRETDRDRSPAHSGTVPFRLRLAG